MRSATPQKSPKLLGGHLALGPPILKLLVVTMGRRNAEEEAAIFGLISAVGAHSVVVRIRKCRFSSFRKLEKCHEAKVMLSCSVAD